MKEGKGVERFLMIQQKLEALREMGEAVLLRPVKLEEIKELERKLRKRLPEEYVSFLVHIGSGYVGRYRSPIYSPDEVWSEYKHFCKLEKTYRHYHVKVPSFKDLTLERLKEEAALLPPESSGYVTVSIGQLAEGAIPVVSGGCAGMNMLIIRGKETGSMWNTACEGPYVTSPQIGPMKYPFNLETLSFIPWIESWLEEKIKLCQIIQREKNNF